MHGDGNFILVVGQIHSFSNSERSNSEYEATALDKILALKRILL